MTSKFLKNAVLSLCKNFIIQLTQFHILKERAFLRGRMRLRVQPQLEDYIFSECIVKFSLFFRAFTYNYSLLDYTVQILSKAGYETHA